MAGVTVRNVSVLFVVPVMLPLVSVTVFTVSLEVPMANVAPLTLRLVPLIEPPLSGVDDLVERNVLALARDECVESHQVLDLAPLVGTETERDGDQPVALPHVS